MTQEGSRPRWEPASSIHQALVAEMELRGSRTIAEYEAAEREAVLNAARLQAVRMGVVTPTIDDVVRCEMQARGHFNYASMWAYAVADMLHRAARCSATRAVSVDAPL